MILLGKVYKKATRTLIMNGKLTNENLTIMEEIKFQKTFFLLIL